MLDSCGADEDSRRTLIEILSATLVGHLLRKLTEEEFLSYSEPVSYMTAPRLVCSPADGAADALRLVMESIVLNTAVPLDAKVKKGDVFNLMPPFLPKTAMRAILLTAPMRWSVQASGAKMNTNCFLMKG